MASTNFVKYTVKEIDLRKTTFIVGPRLDGFSAQNFNLLSKYNIDLSTILSVTDRFVPMNSVYRCAWFPWIEGKYPTEEVIYGSLTTLRDWVINQGVKTIYIHCDAGTHRSPSIMGFYLEAFKDYIATVETIPLFKEEPLEGEELHFSDAVEYAHTYLERPFGENYKILLPAIAKNFYGSNDFLENVLKDLGWKKGFPSKRQWSIYEESEEK